MNATLLGAAISSAIVGAALGYLAWTLLAIATCPRVVDPQLGRFEVVRREQLRRRNWIYRLFEPAIDELVAGTAGRRPALEEQLGRELTTAGEPAPWRAAECAAVWTIESMIVALTVAGFAWLLGGKLAALVLGLVTFFFYRSSKAGGLRKRARRRGETIKRSLASAIDLLALMMEVGGNFQDGLATVTRRMQNTPLGDELNRVLADIGAGRPRKEALRSFADRIGDDDAAELVFAIVQGEELGTPLVNILRGQSEQMRQKRSQWAEKASEVAQVTIVFPAMLIMLACLIIVAAPFIINALYTMTA
jgi:tight adherence protein C